MRRCGFVKELVQVAEAVLHGPCVLLRRRRRVFDVRGHFVGPDLQLVADAGHLAHQLRHARRHGVPRAGRPLHGLVPVCALRVAQAAAAVALVEVKRRHLRGEFFMGF